MAPRDGNGVYTAPANSWNPAVANTEIDENDWAAILADYSTALTQSIAVDGQTTTTASVPFAVGISVGVQQSSRAGVVLNNAAAGAFATTLQSSNSATAAYSITTPPAAPTANGMGLSFTTAGVGSFVTPNFATLTTVQLLTSGSGATYTPTAGARYLRVTIKGAGGGGSGVGTTNPNNSTAGGNSSFNDGGTPIVAVGGGRGNSVVGPGVGGTGGSGTANYRIPGAPGNTPASLVEGGNARTFGGSGGGQGGSIGGPGFATAAASTAFNGGGGGGGSIGLQSFASLASWYVGFGGGEGETAVVWLPAASYTYTVGGGGSAGSGGTGGAQGGQGGSGIIIVEEFY